MVAARWQATIVDEFGNVQTGASIEVRREVGGSPLASIYSDRAGVVPLGNPFTSDGNGFGAFHAAGGAYQITATKGSFSRVWRYVAIGTAAERDSGAFAELDEDGLSSGVNLEAGAAINWDLGDVTITHSAGALAFAGASAGYSFDDDITQSALGGFWKDVSPFCNIVRADRMFIGNAATCPGNFNGTQGGDVAPTITDGANWALRDGQFISVAETGLIGIVGFSKSSQQIAAPTECIGVGGFVINDKASGLAWGLYSDVQHESGATASYGVEVAVKNKGSNVSPDPYNLAPGAYGFWAAGGGDNVYGGNAANPSAAAMAILSGTHSWNRGIVFEADGITGTDGVTGTGIAIDMAKGHTVRWQKSSGVLGASIRSDVATSNKDCSQIFSDDQFAFYGNGGRVILQGNHNHASAVNNIGITNAQTLVAPSVLSLGTDTDVGLALKAKGTGATSVVHVPTHKFVIGAISAILSAPGSSPVLQVQGIDGTTAAAGVSRFSANASSPHYYLSKSRNATIGSHTIVQSGDTLGDIQFLGSDGAKFVLGAFIGAVVDGTPGTDDLPTRLTFQTSPDGAATPVERFRIGAEGFSQVIGGAFGRAAPVTKTADFTVAATENWLINNKAATACTVTLPSASAFSGREIMIKNGSNAQAANSAASNVTQRNSSATNAVITAAGAGNWAILVSDGTNWVIMAGS